MFPWVEIAHLLLITTVSVFAEPLFWIVMSLVAYQYWSMKKNQHAMFGVSGVPFARQVYWAALYGMVGGLVGSFALTLVGVNIERLGIEFIWPLAIALAMVNMRFLCFAYAGGIVAISSALFGWPDVDVPSVLALVACLHITESALIAISGKYSSVPVILKQGGRLVGAFNLQNFWPLPLVVLGTVAMPSGTLPEGYLNMPDWWPLLPLHLEAPTGKQWVYVMFPVVAALGYTDMAVSSTPRQRRNRSALSLAVYSSILLVMALLAAKYGWMKLPAALLSPLGHEYLVRRDNRTEMNGEPRYVPPDRGVMVLDVLPKSLASRLGIQTGDILLALAGMQINRGAELAYAIDYAPESFRLTFERDGKTLEAIGRFTMQERQLGIILVPEGHEQYYVTMDDEMGGFFKRLWQRVRHWLPGGRKP
jgi:hypothetical protein